jgi:hypothetical protein
MKNESEEFEVATGAELAAKHGLTAENRPRIKLDVSKIPPSLHPLIPYAEFWGVSDDIMREDLIEKASDADLYEFARTMERYWRELYDWLTSPTESRQNLDQEYVAFSAMGMASELVRVILDQRNEAKIANRAGIKPEQDGSG